MRRSLGLVATFVVLVVGGYTGLWFYNAANLKKQIESQVVQANAMLGVFVGGTIEYSALETSGFPFVICVNMRDPKLDAVNHQVQSEMKTISLSTNVLGTSYTLGMHGDWHLKVPAFAEGMGESFELVSKGNEPTTYTMRLNKGNVLKLISSFVLGDLSLNPWRDQEFDLGTIDSVETETSAVKYLDKTSGATLVQQDLSVASVNFNKLAENNYSISIQGDVKNVEFTKEFDELYRKILKLIGEMAPKDGEKTSWMQQINPGLSSPGLSWYGKQTYSFAVNYNGLVNLLQPPANDHNLSLNVKKFDTQSDLGTSTLQCVIEATVDPQWMPKNISVKLNTSATATPKYDDFAKLAFESIIKDIVTVQKAEAGIANIENILESTGMLIPKFSTWGETKLTLAGSFNGETQELTLDQLLFALDFARVEGSGHFKLIDQLPVGTGKITISKYQDLVRNLTQYANLWMKVLNGGKTETSIAPEVIITFLQTFASLSGQDQQDATFTIDYNANQLTINGKDFGEILAKFMIEVSPQITPLLQQGQDATAKLPQVEATSE